MVLKWKCPLCNALHDGQYALTTLLSKTFTPVEVQEKVEPKAKEIEVRKPLPKLKPKPKAKEYDYEETEEEKPEEEYEDLSLS